MDNTGLSQKQARPISDASVLIYCSNTNNNNNNNSNNNNNTNNNNNSNNNKNNNNNNDNNHHNNNDDNVCIIFGRTGLRIGPSKATKLLAIVWRGPFSSKTSKS